MSKEDKSNDLSLISKSIMFNIEKYEHYINNCKAKIESFEGQISNAGSIVSGLKIALNIVEHDFEKVSEFCPDDEMSEVEWNRFLNI